MMSFKHYRLALAFAVPLTLIACSGGGEDPAQTDTGADAAAAESEKLHAIFEDHYQDGLEMNPIGATFQGVDTWNHIWPDTLSDEYIARTEAMTDEYLLRIRAIDPTLLDEQDRLSYQMFVDDLEMDVAGREYPGELIPINQFYNAANFFAQLGSGASAQPFSDVDDYEDWLGRVDGFSVWVDTAIMRMRQGVEQGVVQPKVLMRKVLPQLAAHITDDPEESLFWRPVSNMPEEVSAEDRERLTEAYRAAIEDSIVPTYRKLHDFIADEYMEHARDTAGMVHLPDGEDWYAYNVRRTTTTDLTPDQIHRIGLDEVARIHDEMRGVMREVEFEGDLHDFFTFMQTDDRFYFESEEELLESYNSLRGMAATAADELFSLQPAADYEIRPVEAFRAASSSAASYSRAAPDGSRPGIFYVNTYDLSARPRYAMEALFLHEAVPGHHFQIAIQQELTELPEFRRFGGYTAFTEGWGLYSESLGKEMGFYTDPYMYYGKLQAELWRAIRLVVDTGMHHKGWTREQALEYAYANSDVAETRAVSEIERFLAIPSQALAYKIGQLKIQELRDRAEGILGDSFDIKGFHAVVIGAGALPLSVLEDRVDAWIEEQL